MNTVMNSEQILGSEKCVARQFCPCVNVTDCTYTNLDGVVCYMPMLYDIAYCSLATSLYSMFLYKTATD